jgi:uncharacterized protein YlxW (UPF0749 family)
VAKYIIFIILISCSNSYAGLAAYRAVEQAQIAEQKAQTLESYYNKARNVAFDLEQQLIREQELNKSLRKEISILEKTNQSLQKELRTTAKALAECNHKIGSGAEKH